MRTLILLLVITVVLTQAKVSKKEWRAFKEKHGKSYDNSAAESAAKESYGRKRDRIDKHNELYDLGQVSFKMGFNKYSDVPHEDFVHSMNGFRQSDVKVSMDSEMKLIPTIDVKALPTTIDWSSKGYVTPVKDQGQCGSCWAFSATGSLEGQRFRKSKTLVSLSEQQLVDCAGLLYGNYGCSGGLMDNAFNYVQTNQGISSGASYPYTGRQSSCKRITSLVKIGVTGRVSIPSGNETALQDAVATIGPVSIAIDASRRSFQSYKSGVYYDAACSSTKLDHGVLVVGYGTSSAGQDYWLVKNSWGTSWGEKGYVRIARNRNNHCGVATLASYPIV